RRGIIPIIDLHQIHRKSPRKHVKPTLLHAVRPPSPNQVRICIFYDVETLYLRHVEIVDKSNLSPMIFSYSSYDGFQNIFFHDYIVDTVFSTYFRITPVFITRYNILKPPSSSSVNIHCVVTSLLAKWITASPIRSCIAPYKKEISSLLTPASLPKNW